MKALIKLIRVHQWVKNVFVFMPVFFAGEIFNQKMIWESVIGFFMFSFTASAIYVINDYVDIEKDRMHPTKRNRPLASGAISKGPALLIFATCLLISLFITLYTDNQKAGLIVLVYFVMNLAYSFKLKHVPLIDVTIIAVGFLMRVLVGGYVTGLIITKWSILLVFMLALLMALGKRSGELNSEVKGKARKALDGYNKEFLQSAIGLVSGVAIVCYIMYCFSENAAATFGTSTNYLIYTVIFVILGVMRYLQQTIVYHKTESPTKMLYKDFFLQVVLLAWFLSFVLLIYYKS